MVIPYDATRCFGGFCTHSYSPLVVIQKCTFGADELVFVCFQRNPPNSLRLSSTSIFGVISVGLTRHGATT